MDGYWEKRRDIRRNVEALEEMKGKWENLEKVGEWRESGRSGEKVEKMERKWKKLRNTGRRGETLGEIERHWDKKDRPKGEIKISEMKCFQSTDLGKTKGSRIPLG